MIQPADLDEQPVALRLWGRREAFAPFAIAGSVGVIAGGLLASVIAAPTPTRHGVWAVAYLVLVLGVGQLVLGAGQALLPAEPASLRAAALTAVLFNTAGLAIMAGVVTGHVAVFAVGAALLFATLLLFLYTVRDAARRTWPLYAYRLFIGALVVSIPIGTFITTAAG